ncbi:hypothetical protein GEMRC1_006047 [Eukaryota sp. GEM-RC1]
MDPFIVTTADSAPQDQGSVVQSSLYSVSSAVVATADSAPQDQGSVVQSFLYSVSSAVVATADSAPQDQGSVVQSGLRYVSSAVVSAITIHQKNRWCHDLTNDGDVEANPGPPDEFVHIHKLYHGSCATIPHDTILHPVKKIKGFFVCTCLEHHRQHPSNRTSSGLNSLKDIPAYTTLKAESYLYQIQRYFGAHLGQMSFDKHFIPYFIATESALDPLQKDKFFADFIQYHQAILDSQDTISLPIMPAPSLSTPASDCQSYEICNYCMLPGHKSTIKGEPLCCLRSRPLSYQNFTRVVNYFSCYIPSTMLAYALTVCHKYILTEPHLKEVKMFPVPVSHVSTVAETLDDLYFSALLNEIRHYARCNGLVSEQTSIESENGDDFNSDYLDMDKRIDNFAFSLESVDQNLHSTWIFRSLYRFVVFAKIYVESDSDVQTEYRKSHLDSLYLFIFMLGYQSYIISQDSSEIYEFSNLIKFPFDFFKSMFNEKDDEFTILEAIDNALRYKRKTKPQSVVQLDQVIVPQVSSLMEEDLMEESEGNTHPELIAGRQAETPLSELGLHQSQLLGDRLRELSNFHVYCSPLLRARETARISLGDDLYKNATIVSELQEFTNGDWDGRRRSEVYTPEQLAKINSAGYLFTPPGGESQRMVQRRASNWLEDEILYNTEFQTGDHTVLVFSHNIVIKSLLHYILGFSDRFIYRFSLDNTGICEFHFKEDGWYPIAINDRSHLSKFD